MRRLFIIRKDLHLSPGKLAAMVGHCAEAYWTRLIRSNTNTISGADENGSCNNYISCFTIDRKIYEEYINGIFTKTICEARNKNHLLKAKNMALDLGLVEDVDFGEINDYCLTELQPENEDGTTLVGIWFKPLDDDIVHKISKKYQLYH